MVSSLWTVGFDFVGSWAGCGTSPGISSGIGCGSTLLVGWACSLFGCGTSLGIVPGLGCGTTLAGTAGVVSGQLTVPSTLCIFKSWEFLAGALRMTSPKRYSAPARNSEKIHMLLPKIPKHYAHARSSNEFSEFLVGAHVFFPEFLAGAEYFFGCHSQDSRQKVLFLFSRHSGQSLNYLRAQEAQEARGKIM